MRIASIILSIVVVLITTIFSSCIPSSSNRTSMFPNPQQQQFDDMLARFNNDDSKYIGNKIKKQEFLDSVRHATFEYVDSVKLFVNWKGNISHIDSDKYGNSTALTFDINYKPKQYREVTFKCTYILPNDSLETDELYQYVKSLDGYETVYFDGFIRTLSDNTVKYSSYLTSDDLFLPYPKFEFFIIDVSKTPKDNILSEDMQRAVDLTFEVIEPLKANFRKEISKKEMTARINGIAPKYDEAKSKLTTSQRNYIQRLSQACSYNFLYADSN
ncbi:MAG: hypothetical protein NC418_04050 [Muribaculaceae bacterium]|nr:hypothetical protein [Muribaculaceae bacterium]MCM1142915.1 hypothetical protein [Muribaculum sp.]